MCRCTPEIKTPFCGRGDCQWPDQKPKPSRFDDILARLRAAKGPDRELDAMIIVALSSGKQVKLGRKPGTIIEHYYPGTWGTRTAQTVTASIDDALALVEEILPGATVPHAGHVGDGGWIWQFSTPIRFSCFNGTAPTAPLAILIVLFEALKAKEEKE